jgi:hypothetical protein
MARRKERNVFKVKLEAGRMAGAFERREAFDDCQDT